MEFSAEQIAGVLQGEVVGDASATVSTFAKIEEGMPGALSFLGNAKYAHYIYDTESSIILVTRDFQPEKEVKATLIRVDNPYEALATLMQMVEQAKPKKQGIHPTAVVAETATLSEDVYVGPYAVIGEGSSVGAGSMIHPHVCVGDGVKIGEGCVLYPHSTVYDGCIMGDRCVLHAGSVLGADGFGFAPTADGYDKIPQIGIAQLEDDVDLGANACVDRATMGRTIVRKGVKLDNMVQIAHNCEVGAHTVMSAQVGVAGTTKIGEWCMFGGQVGLAGHLEIGDKVQIGAQSGIPGNVKSESQVMGSPAMPIKDFFRASAVIKTLPEMRRTVNRLEKEIEALKK